MGQLLPQNDSYSYLTAAPRQTNSQPVHRCYNIQVCPGLCVKQCSIMYSHQDTHHIERVYRFMDNKYINVRVTKKVYHFNTLQYTNQNDKEVIINGEPVYGYKIKYRHKSVDKIKSILFKKRIYGHKDKLLLNIAQLKLLAVLQTGPYLGTMLDGSDAYLHIIPKQLPRQINKQQKSQQIPIKQVGNKVKEEQGSIQYYSQVLIGFKSNLQKLQKKLQKYFTATRDNKIKQYGYSTLYHDLVLQPQLINYNQQQFQQQQKQQQHITNTNVRLKSEQQLLNINSNTNSNKLSTFNLLQASSIMNNPSQNIRISAINIQQRYAKQIRLLDEKTRNLTAIQHTLTHKNIQKSVSIFQQSMQHISKNGNITDHTSSIDKLKFVYLFVDLLQDCGDFKTYEEQVIMEILNDSQIMHQSNRSLSQSQNKDQFKQQNIKNKHIKDIRKGKSESKQQNQVRMMRNILEQKVGAIKLQSKQFSSQSQLQQFSQSYSSKLQPTQIQKSKLKLNIQDNNKMRIKSLMTSLSQHQSMLVPVQSATSQQPLVMTDQLGVIEAQSPTNRNKNKNKSKKKQCDKPVISEHVTYEYIMMLMKSGKSRLALTLFQLLARKQGASEQIKSSCYIYMGLIYYFRNYYSQARNHWQQAILKLIRKYMYGDKLIMLYNNVACSFYAQGKYDRAADILSYAMQKQYVKSDYSALLRNNRAICYLKMGDTKQAREQFMVILNKGEPIRNASLLYKIYSNLGYMSMASKQFAKAKDDLKLAMDIQQQCLLPNGYTPSIFLHNNVAMVRYKLREYRQSLDHYLKYMWVFEKATGMNGVMINYNIALVYRQCYKNQLASQYIDKARRMLNSISSKSITNAERVRLEKKIQTQCENISRNNIDQVSQESSGAIIDNIVSTLSRKHLSFKDEVFGLGTTIKQPFE